MLRWYLVDFLFMKFLVTHGFYNVRIINYYCRKILGYKTITIGRINSHIHNCDQSQSVKFLLGREHVIIKAVRIVEENASVRCVVK